MPTVTKVDSSIYPFGFLQMSGSNAANWDYSYSPPSSWIPLISSKTGSSLPGYKRLIAQAQQATTNFSGELQDARTIPSFEKTFGNTTIPPSTAGNRKRVSYWVPAELRSLPAAGLVPSSSVNIARNLAQQRFYKNLESVSTLFQGGVFLGELRETLRMIRNPAQGLRRGVGSYLDALKKRRRGNQSQRQKILSDTWLEYSFGWIPLLNDLDDARKYLERRHKQLEREVIRVRGDGEHSTTLFSSDQDTTGVGSTFCQIRKRLTATSTYAGAVSSRASSSRLIDASALGLSPRSFVPTLWEVLPWSFVIDYFTNIGDVISAWSNQNVALSWGRETHRTDAYYDTCYWIGTGRPISVTNWTSFDYSFTPGFASTRRKTVDRSKITYVPVPSFSFELPGFGTKWLNIAALVSSRRAFSRY